MSEGARQTGWQRAVEAYLARFTGPDIGFRQMFLLWVTAVSAVLLVCVVFLVTMYWILG